MNQSRLKIEPQSKEIASKSRQYGNNSMITKQTISNQPTNQPTNQPGADTGGRRGWRSQPPPPQAGGGRGAIFFKISKYMRKRRVL